MYNYFDKNKMEKIIMRNILMKIMQGLKMKMNIKKIKKLKRKVLERNMEQKSKNSNQSSFSMLKI